MYDSQHWSEETQLTVAEINVLSAHGIAVLCNHDPHGATRPCNKVQLPTNTLLSPSFLPQLCFLAVAFSTFPVLGPWSELLKYLLVPESRVCICFFYSYRENPLVLQGRGDILYSCIVLSSLYF